MELYDVEDELQQMRAGWMTAVFLLCVLLTKSLWSSLFFNSADALFDVKTASEEGAEDTGGEERVNKKHFVSSDS